MTVASHILFLLVTALVVLLGVVTAVCASTAHAQGADDSPPLADLVIASEQFHLSHPAQNWKITVRNNPVGDQGPKFRVVKVEVVINDGINAPVTEVHTIRDLPAGRSADLFVPFPVFTTGVCSSSPVLSRVHAKIIETDPLEPPGLRFNNATENVGLACPVTRFNNGDVGVIVNVSDRNPQPGGTTTFTVSAENDPGPSVHLLTDQNNVQFDVRVKISLSPGLNFGTTTAPDGTTFSTTTGNWDVGTLTPPALDEAGSHKSLPVAVNLTADSVAEIPLGERCLTADVTRAKPWFAWDGSKRLNDTYTACLGEQPKVFLAKGKTTLFDFYPCVGVTAYPCTSADTLELVVTRPPGAGVIISGKAFAQPDEFLVHIIDPEGRKKIGAGRPFWTTSGIFDFKDSQLRLPDTAWSAAREDLTVTGPGGGELPGSFTIDFPAASLIPDIVITGTTKVTGDSFDTGYDVDFDLNFGGLGTYVLTMDIRATHSTARLLTDSGTYTFRVGPMADLGVRDAGVNPAVAAGRQGYTVMALNNGPDIAPDVQVTLSGVPEGAEAVPSHGHGSYAQGACQDSLCQGVWAIGELGLGDYRASGHANESPTLTLITDDAMPADITATIANTRDYSVCIDSDGSDIAAANESACTGNTGATWHTTPYYDHIEPNNTATIAAFAGSGDGRPDAPTNLRVVETPVGNIVQWEAVETVNGHGVAHYQVQRSASPWTTVAEKAKETVYADMGSSGSASYRVRAMNQFDVPGSWSQPSGQPGAPGNFSASVGSGQINLSWSAPQGVTVTGYNLDYSTDGGGAWTSLPDQAATATSYNHTGLTLTPGAAWHYRLRAVGDGFTSDWEETSATVPYPKPGVPKSFTATSESETQAELSWSAPDAVTHVNVTGYELDFSTDGGVTWTRLTGTPTLDGTTYTLTHSDSGLAADAVRQYRARTTGTVGSGSEQVSVRSDWVYALATEDYPSPGAPRDFAAKAASDTEVTLTWNAPEAVTDVNLTGYELEVSIDRGVTWTSVATASTLGAGATSHTHTDAANPLSSKPRQYRLKAVGTVGGSQYESGWVFAVPAGEVGPPQNLTATADGRNRIDLTWDQPGFGAEAVTGYRIDHTPATSEDWETLEHGYRTSPRRYEHGGLLPGERHCYRVAAIYAGGTGPFAARVCATTEGAPSDLPGEPENLRVAQMGSNYVVLEWDPPSVGGPVEYYQWQSNIHQPGEVTPRTATSVRVGGLPPGSTYSFQVRAGNSYGPGGWSTSIPVTLHRAVSAVKASPDELEVEKGGSGSFNVSLNRSPQWPLSLYLIWEGPDCLTESLPYQQGKILLPTNPPPSKEFWDDFWWGPPEDRFAVPWNAGLDIRLDASGCQGGETAVVNYDLWSLPFSALKGLPMWEELNLNQEEWREKWGVDPLDGVSGPSVKVTVEDGGVSGQQSSPGAVAQPTAVTLALDAATVSESAGEVTLTATLDAPAPEGGMGGFLLADAEGTASEHIDFTMPFSIFIPGGQRSATATISITGDDLDEADETVVMSALFDIGTALLEDKITLSITDDDTAGVTVSAASGLAVAEGGSASYTVVLDSQPTQDVTVSASSGDGAKVSVSPGTNTFTPSEWNTPLTFTVNGLADTDTNDESVGISHWITSDDWKYAVFPVATVSVSVSDTTPEQQQGTPNQAPTVASAIGDATIVNESGTKQISLSGVFSDADSDPLTVAAASDDESVATVSVAVDYSSLTVTAQARGTATITVTASDGRGGTVSDAFTVTVKAAPVVASAISDVSGLEAGATQDVSLIGVFSDADGDSLSITAVSSDEAKATVSVAADHSSLTVEGVAEGTVTITVTAQDSEGNRVSDTFEVAVEPEQDPPPDEETPDGTPTVAQPLPDISLEGLQWRQFSLPGVFHDPDGDELTFTVVSSDYGVATAWVVGSTLTVVAASTGTATITVTAEDPEGNRVSDAFQVTVTPAS